MRRLGTQVLTISDVQLYGVCTQRMHTLRAHIRTLFAARADTTTPPEGIPARGDTRPSWPCPFLTWHRVPTDRPSTTHWRASPLTPPTCLPVPTPTPLPPADPPVMFFAVLQEGRSRHDCVPLSNG